MTTAVVWRCPYGGCGPYGYCPCAEAADDSEFLRRARITTLPPIDTYEPREETSCPRSTWSA
ncbi:hypothetical protein [Streptomyces sp. NPDC045251]|uniref:hypothetical protein n=1 Tax=unclassified Streptomyces TaxID=2593676 RepID=UPI0033C9B078